jgi:hypothetical protein
LAKLGIAAAVAAKVKLTSGPVAELVARGEAELGMQQIIASKCHYLCRRIVAALSKCGSGEGFRCLHAWRARKTADAR